MKSMILKPVALTLAMAVAMPALPRPAVAKASTDAAVAGGLAGALLLGAAIGHSRKKKKQTTIIYQQAPPPPPVIVAPPPAAPPPIAQAPPQLLPPNCQVVLQTIHVEGIPQPQQAQSIACRQPDGSWVYR